MSQIVRIFWRTLACRVLAVQSKTYISQSNMSSPAVSKGPGSGEALRKLREFGYAFNANGQLRKIDMNTGEPGEQPFEFEISTDHAQNQAHYEKLADQIPEIVYDLLEQNGLSRTYIPETVPPEEATFIFSQPERLVKPKKLIVIIHGSGFVRAGQWARSLIINNSLDHGTQIPYVKKAQELGYDILITNTNDNYRTVDGVRKPITGLNTASAHANYVWEKHVVASQPESVAIVAHSAGGAITLDLAKRFPEFFKRKVFAIALTDSAHFAVPEAIREMIADKTCNWVSSHEPLDTVIEAPKGGMKMVSAGHAKHEWTSYSAIESVFKFLEEKYESFKGEQSNKRPRMDEK